MIFISLLLLLLLVLAGGSSFVYCPRPMAYTHAQGKWCPLMFR